MPISKKNLLEKNVIIKRNVQRVVGVFVDGVSLDRACKRLKKRIDFGALLSSVSLGLSPSIARYYTIVPFEDDSRHRSYLDAVEDAGFQVVVNRLPPKGVEKMVSIDPHISADIIAFGTRGITPFVDSPTIEDQKSNALHSAVLVCPSKELSYPIGLLDHLGVETTTADFGVFSGANVLKSAKKWIDLTDSELIWK